MSFPCGDQSSVQQPNVDDGGRICLSPVPFALTTNTPSSPVGPKRWNTIRLPFGDQLPGTSSPPGFEVTCRRPPPSDERIT